MTTSIKQPRTQMPVTRSECGMWLSAPFSFLHFFMAVIAVIETAATATEIREPRGKANNEPFFQIERLKQDFLHQLERFTKRPENFDSRLDSIHARHSEAS